MTRLQSIQNSMSNAVVYSKTTLQEAKATLQNKAQHAKVWMDQNVAPHYSKIAVTAAAFAAATLSALALRNFLNSTTPQTPQAKPTNPIQNQLIDCDYYLDNQYVLALTNACANYTRPVSNFVTTVIANLNTNTTNQEVCVLADKPVVDLTGLISHTPTTPKVADDSSNNSINNETNLANASTKQELVEDSSNNVLNNQSNVTNTSTTQKANNSDIVDDLDPQEFDDMKPYEILLEMAREHNITVESSAAGLTVGALTGLLINKLTAPIFYHTVAGPTTQNSQNGAATPVIDQALKTAVEQAIERLTTLVAPILKDKLVGAELAPLQAFIKEQLGGSNLDVSQRSTFNTILTRITTLVNGHSTNAGPLSIGNRQTIINIVLDELKNSEVDGIRKAVAQLSGKKLAQNENGFFKATIATLTALLPEVPAALEPITGVVNEVQARWTAAKYTLITSVTALTAVISAVAAQRIYRI